jgi:DHA2 family multidrug resistance protein-like MFS transporter
MQDETPAEGRRAGRREWVGLAVLALPTLLLALDASVLYLALPHLTAALRPSSVQLLWITDIYGFLLAGFLITMGTLGDHIGRKRLLLLGATAFAIASMLAAWASSPEMLIATRALLGVAGATLAPSTLALISNMFGDSGQRGTAIAIWSSCFMAGAIIGPLVGGLLLQHFWWGSVFLLGVPVMVMLLATGPLLLPEYRDPNPGRLDLASVALSLATILPVVYGLKELARSGWRPLPGVAIAIGAVVGVVFVRRQRRLASPLLDLRLLGSRAFSAALGIGLFVGVIMGGVYLFVTQYLQLVAGLSPLRAGLWLVPPALVMIAMSMLAPTVGRRFGSGPVIGVGLLVVAVGLVVLTRAGGGGLAVVVGSYGVVSLGVGVIGVLGIDLVVGTAPPERAGSASALSETSGELGLAPGVALLGSLGTAVYRGQVAATLPAGVPAELARAAHDTLAGATAAAGQLQGQLAIALLAAARQAFTSGLHDVAGVSAAIAAAYAAVVMILFRRVRPGRDAQLAPTADHNPGRPM